MGFGVVNHGAARHFNYQIGPGLAMAVFAASPLAVTGFELGLVFEIQQRMQVVRRLDIHRAAMTTVASGGAAVCNEFLTAPGNHAVAPIPGLYYDSDVIDKLHERFPRCGYKLERLLSYNGPPGNDKYCQTGSRVCPQPQSISIIGSVSLISCPLEVSVKNRLIPASLTLLSLLFLVIMGLNPVKSQPLAESDDSTAPVLTVIPGSLVKQGAIVIARLESADDSLAQGKATLDGRTSPLFKQEDGSYQALFGISVDTKPGGHTLTVYDGSGQEISKRVVNVQDGRFRRQNIVVSKSTEGLKPLPGELEAIQALKENMTASRYWEKPFVSPTPDCQNSPFGVKRYHNGTYTHDYHKGVDLRSPNGRPIKAINNGVVKIAKQYRLHGGTVGLDHGQGLNSIFIHMSKIAVKEGDRVNKGDTIGYVGSTGFATGPHLHWGLYANGVPVNPDQWIPQASCR